MYIIDRLAGKNIVDILSVSLLAVIIIFTVIHCWAGPQFIDGYYHLSCAEAFIKSGGWVGVDWWSISPQVRPHLYPPFYHLFLALLLKCGISGVDSLRLSECLTGILFFLLTWGILRRLFSSRFALLFIILVFGFFPFYVSVAANVPASLALLMAFLSFYFFMLRRPSSAIVFLSLCFYTHTGVAVIFLLGYLFAAFVDRAQRAGIFKLLGVSLLTALPILIHQAVHLPQVRFLLLYQDRQTEISLLVSFFCIAGAFYAWKNRKFAQLFFLGLLVSSAAVFFKYPYRLFSAQGVVFAGLLAAFAAEKIICRLKPEYRNLIIIAFFVAALFFHPAESWGNAGPRLKLSESTFSVLASGRWHENIEFCNVYYPELFLPAIKLIESNSGPQDIIDSNVGVVAQMLSSLTDRLSARSLYREVKGKENPIHAAKLIVWMKSFSGVPENAGSLAGLKKLFENEIYLLLENPSYRGEVVPPRSKFSFPLILGLVLLAAAVVLGENVVFLGKCS